MPSPPLCAPADPDPRPARFTPPPGTCDCHFHVIGDAQTYPFAEGRAYTPPPSPLSAWQHVRDKLGMTRGVIVQPSYYGIDNRATLDAVATDPENLRCVVVVDASITDDTLHAMHKSGARGARINLLYAGGATREALEIVAAKIAPLGWHIQLLIDVSTFPDLYETMAALPVDTVFDHIGHMSTTKGLDNVGFRAMLRLIGEGRSWVKLSGGYRVTAERDSPYGDVVPFARAAFEADPSRSVWGTDWHHPSVTIPMPNDGTLLDMLADWIPDEAARNRVLVDNPATLYDF